MPSQFYEAARLGDKQSVTAEGFLVCHDVPIARTGSMRYLAAEVTDDEHPIVGDTEGVVVAERTPEEVFRAETIASFNGKPVTIDHPDELVGPDNWRQLAAGHLQNVRRGDGAQDDLLLADLLITDRAAIDAVRAGLREVSCGYEATYDQVAPGRAMQRGILGNHLALVARGRCGPRCAIGDSHKEATTMTTTTKTNDQGAATPKSKRKGVADKLRGLLTFLDADEGDGDEEGDGDDDKGKKTGDAAPRKAIAAAVKDAMAPVLDKLKALDEDMEELKEKKTDDNGEDLTDPKTAEHNKEAKGEAWTGDSLEVTLQRAEILAPGGPRFIADAKVKVGDAVCNCQRAALKRASVADSTKDALAPLLAGVDIEKATYDTLRPLFIAATEIARARNAPRVHGVSTADAARVGDAGKPVSVADVQKSYSDYWAARRG